MKSTSQFLFAIFLLVLISGLNLNNAMEDKLAEGEGCPENEFISCITQLRLQRVPFDKNVLNVVFNITSEAKLQHTCRAYSDVLPCFRDRVVRCGNRKQRRMLDEVKKMLMFFCSPFSVRRQHEFLKYSECIGKELQQPLSTSCFFDHHPLSKKIEACRHNCERKQEFICMMEVWVSEQSLCTVVDITNACGPEASTFYTELQAHVFNEDFPVVCRAPDFNSDGSKSSVDSFPGKSKVTPVDGNKFAYIPTTPRPPRLTTSSYKSANGKVDENEVTLPYNSETTEIFKFPPLPTLGLNTGNIFPSPPISPPAWPASSSNIVPNVSNPQNGFSTNVNNNQWGVPAPSINQPGPWSSNPNNLIPASFPNNNQNGYSQSNQNSQLPGFPGQSQSNQFPGQSNQLPGFSLPASNLPFPTIPPLPGTNGNQPSINLPNIFSSSSNNAASNTNPGTSWNNQNGNNNGVQIPALPNTNSLLPNLFANSNNNALPSIPGIGSANPADQWMTNILSSIPGLSSNGSLQMPSSSNSANNNGNGQWNNASPLSPSTRNLNVNSPPQPISIIPDQFVQNNGLSKFLQPNNFMEPFKQIGMPAPGAWQPQANWERGQPYTPQGQPQQNGGSPYQGWGDQVTLGPPGTQRPDVYHARSTSTTRYPSYNTGGYNNNNFQNNVGEQPYQWRTTYYPPSTGYTLPPELGVMPTLPTIPPLIYPNDNRRTVTPTYYGDPNQNGMMTTSYPYHQQQPYQQFGTMRTLPPFLPIRPIATNEDDKNWYLLSQSSVGTTPEYNNVPAWAAPGTTPYTSTSYRPHWTPNGAITSRTNDSWGIRLPSFLTTPPMFGHNTDGYQFTAPGITWEPLMNHAITRPPWFPRGSQLNSISLPQSGKSSDGFSPASSRSNYGYYQSKSAVKPDCSISATGLWAIIINFVMILLLR